MKFLTHCCGIYLLNCVLFVKDEAMNPAIKEMEAMILECAKLDREINHFADIVQQVIQVNTRWGII